MAKQSSIGKDADNIVTSTYKQLNTTNTAVTNPQIAFGYGIIAGAAAQNITETVTLPVTFDNVPIVVTNPAGYHSSSSTYGVTTDNYGACNYVTSQVREASTSSFEIFMWKQDANNFASSGNYFYTWIAIEQKA